MYDIAVNKRLDHFFRAKPAGSGPGIDEVPGAHEGEEGQCQPCADGGSNWWGNQWHGWDQSLDALGKGKAKGKGNRNCYNCGQYGHMARDCSSPKGKGRGPFKGGSKGSYKGSYKGGSKGGYKGGKSNLGIQRLEDESMKQV